MPDKDDYTYAELVELSGLGCYTMLGQYMKRAGIKPYQMGHYGREAMEFAVAYRDSVSSQKILDVSPWKSKVTLTKYLKEAGFKPVCKGRWERSALEWASKQMRSIPDKVVKPMRKKPEPHSRKRKSKCYWRVAVLEDFMWRVTAAGLTLNRAQDLANELSSRGRAVMLRPCRRAGCE
jgi:hypothetical protein